MWDHFGEGPFLFQHDCAPVHKARSIKAWLGEFGVEELDWLADSPDLIPIEHLWDELEQTFPARPSHPTSVSDLTNALLDEWAKIPRLTPTSCREPIDLGYHYYSCRCPSTFVHIMYVSMHFQQMFYVWASQQRDALANLIPIDRLAPRFSTMDNGGCSFLFYLNNKAAD